MRNDTSHRVVVSTSTDRAALDLSSGIPAPAQPAGIAHGWECLDCFRAEAPHYRRHDLAQAAARRHAAPLAADDARSQETHLTAVIQSQAYTVIDLDRHPPAPGLGYGWECLLCDRAEAAVWSTPDQARLAADRHQRARPHDLLSVNQFLDKLDDIGRDVFGVLDHETGEVRAFVLRASPGINDLVQRLTGEIPPPPYGYHRN